MTIQRYSTDDWWPDPEGRGVLFEDHDKAVRQAVEAMQKACIARVEEYLDDEYSPAQLISDLWDISL